MSYGISVTNPRGILTIKGDGDTMKLKNSGSPKLFDYVTHTFKNNPPAPASGVATYNLITINHNLGYLPCSLVYIYNYDLPATYSSADSYAIGLMILHSAGQNGQDFGYTIDRQYLNLHYRVTRTIAAPDISHDVTGHTFGFKYFIFTNEIL